MLTAFEWDPVKASSNYRKHGVSFEIARLAFADPYALTIFDRIVDDEQRWQTIAMIEGCFLLLVVYAIHEVDDDGHLIEIIRIISARPATRKERWRYEQEAR